MLRKLFVVVSCLAILGFDAAPLRATRPLLRPQAVPFRSGEKFAYEASFGFLKVGRGTIELSGFDTIRARPAWRATLTVNGGPPLYKVRDSTISWFDARTLSTLRYVQHLREGSYKADRLYEIFPERATYARSGKPEVPSVSEPLDETSFLFFLRTIPLEVGQSYEFNRYFQPDGNPVVIHVLRREIIKVPAGTFKTIVVQPQIAAPGLFSKKERAEVWISDDNVRMVVQIKSHVIFGSLRLALKSYEAGRDANSVGVIQSGHD